MNKDFFVHESSFIDDGVTVGKGTKIWHFCHLHSGPVSGWLCSLAPNGNIPNPVLVANGGK